MRLCDGLFAAVFRFDGELIHLAAQHNIPAEGIEAMRTHVPGAPEPGPRKWAGDPRRAVVHIPDVERSIQSTHTKR